MLHEEDLCSPIFDDTTSCPGSEDLMCPRGELERRVQERTAELTEIKRSLEATNQELQAEIEAHLDLESELLKAKVAAEDAATAKTQFLANMSHELRTPLNAVIGMSSLLATDDLTDDQKELAEVIKSSGETLLSLIEDILSFSKMEQGKLVIEEKPFNLRQCIEGALDMVAAQAAEKDLNLAYTISSDTPSVIIADSSRLHQILVNLLANAVKFTNFGEVQVHVSSKFSNDLYEVLFAVRDTGIGIPKKLQGQLFQPFFQVDSSSTRMHGGTGLGLAICKSLVENMHGTIWVNSASGNGSTFFFTILAKAADGKDDISSVFNQLIPKLRGKRLLILESNRTNWRILSHYTRKWGMCPYIFDSIQVATDMVCRGEPFDVAIIGSSRGLNQTYLADCIRAHSEDLPLIMLGNVGQIQTSDFAAGITKPIKPAQLLNALRDVLAESHQEPIKEVDRFHETAVAVQEQKHGHLRILIVEDSLSNQKVVVRMLQKLGYRADVATSGLEAITSLERQLYDLVLMDIQMPEMDGLEATAEIRRRWPIGPKIIAVTAYALEGDREKCLMAGMDGYIAKPVKIDDLAEVLKGCSA